MSFYCLKSVKERASPITSSTIGSRDIERKIENATDGLPLKCFNLLHRMLKIPKNKQNVVTICGYIYSLK
jgi:hypothetical protein